MAIRRKRRFIDQLPLRLLVVMRMMKVMMIVDTINNRIWIMDTIKHGRVKWSLCHDVLCLYVVVVGCITGSNKMGR